ncbi:unnamed protein product [Adineta steineri]|uniref:MD-2-related lipid-recognition domain-containing protein n=1 Tax=Adineta steineri TaxID=433720 RepID=A0A819KI37_9BILA|nr:unnamed protein product [Adineta steineri]CAF3947761.1 unnamed protein product [Adineta steineri]CAF3967739.1 unnamed protein product [Adineta steineri]
MAFRIHLLVIYITLFLLSVYHINSFKLEKNLGLKVPSLGFSWENCGPASDPIQIKTLVVAPDPIHVPGNLSISLVVAIGAALPTDIHVSVTMEKKVGGFYVKVPCIDNFGSCTYGNLCEAWADACPKYFEQFRIPCKCPIPADTYTIPGAVIKIGGHLPSVGEGDYRLTGDLGSSGTHLGCLRLQVTLKD